MSYNKSMTVNNTTTTKGKDMTITRNNATFVITRGTAFDLHVTLAGSTQKYYLGGYHCDPLHGGDILAARVNKGIYDLDVDNIRNALAD